ncbi:MULTISPECIES: hypothetical protein [Legionella]|uniref:Uncharacterized protein n=1 Tax=Legionella resiliens TaxID=2905958 RepID=A0ABS8WWI8_9GAMM|nr:MULTISPECIES: hypothetical protein [unclassified Legionella]MCE0721676.1 hypothetical protein [Legionella sp. 9fVS26]MCE3530830.1 hypothetical protein [Legionella sp. 8cVS16]QLZ70391.1 hypothetical protein FOLKNPGA_03205 [Legionella sp. PC1000]
MSFNFSSFQFDKNSSTEAKVKITLELINSLIPSSSTRESLNTDGYPESGPIEQTIRAYQNMNLSLYEQGLKAMETGCGNCQEMAYASGLLLRAGGFTGTLQVAEFGINHAFLIVDDYILDPWSKSFFPFSTWKDNLKAYGGSVKEGVMRGRVLSATHYELEDEVPEVSKTLPTELDQCLPSIENRTKLTLLIGACLSKTQNSKSDPDPQQSVTYST